MKHQPEIKVSAKNYLEKSIADFNLMSLKFNLRPLEKIYFGNDEKKGDILRGGFGGALRSMACSYKWEDMNCKQCDITDSCFYFMYFETNRPHPYLIHPTLGSRRFYSVGEELFFEMILIGEAIQHADKFAKTIEELGRIGVGSKRGRFRIKETETVNPMSYEEPPYTDQFNSGVVIEFLSPLKLKEKEEGIYYARAPFKTLFKLLIKRIINLNNLYCNGRNFDKEKIEREKDVLLKQAEKIEMRPFTEWKDFKRFSSRQQKWMKIGGQMGLVIYSGDLTPFYSYLKIGEVIGAGQHTTSGFGRYKIIPSEKCEPKETA